MAKCREPIVPVGKLDEAVGAAQEVTEVAVKRADVIGHWRSIGFDEPRRRECSRPLVSGFVAARA